MTTRTGAGTPARSTRNATVAPRRTKRQRVVVANPESGDVARAMWCDLGRLPADLAGSVLAASALALAREIDDPGNSATSKSMCARALLDTVDRLLARAPADEERDGLDDLTSRRSNRIASAIT